MRYDIVDDKLDRAELDGDSEDSALDVSFSKLSSELAMFGEGPPTNLPHGSAVRVRWFEQWLQQSRPLESSLGSTLEATALDSLLHAELEALRKVHVAPLEDVKAAFEAHSTLKWDDNLEGACGQDGFLMAEDESDGAVKVRFSSDFIVW